MMTTRLAPRPAPTIGLTRPLAGFAIFCGLVLLLLPGGSAREAARPPEPTVITRAREGLDEAHKAQQALGDANYGEVRAHLARTQESLTWILSQAQGAPHPSPR